MSAQQQLVGAMGVGLIAANAWKGRQGRLLDPVWSNTSASGGQYYTADLDTAHGVVKEVGAELVGVAVLVLVAGASTGAGNAAAAALLALWVLFLIKHQGNTSSKINTPRGMTP